MSGRVAALYVEPDGCYANLAGVDAWDEARAALREDTLGEAEARAQGRAESAARIAELEAEVARKDELIAGLEGNMELLCNLRGEAYARGFAAAREAAAVQCDGVAELAAKRVSDAPYRAACEILATAIRALRPEDNQA